MSKCVICGKEMEGRPNFGQTCSTWCSATANQRDYIEYARANPLMAVLCYKGGKVRGWTLSEPMVEMPTAEAIDEALCMSFAKHPLYPGKVFGFHHDRLVYESSEAITKRVANLAIEIDRKEAKLIIGGITS